MGWALVGGCLALVICPVVAFPDDLPRAWLPWSVAGLAFAALTAYLAVQFGIQWRTDIPTERGDVFSAGVAFLGAVAELVTDLEGPVGAPAGRESPARAPRSVAARAAARRRRRRLGGRGRDAGALAERERRRAHDAHARRPGGGRRLLEAGDAERRRLERDLHDGAQQRLVVLRLARSRAAGDDAVAPLLDEAEDGLRHALDDLPSLARGIHPAALDEGGPAPALRALAARAPFPVTVDCPDRRLPAAVEIATWFVVSEALTNAAKHAEASSARVTVEIGSGRARVAALDGTLTVGDAPEGGTRLVTELPCG